MKKTQLIACFAFLILVASALSASGDSPDADAPDLDWPVVRYVTASESSDGTWRFDVTVEHNDEGWDHYADAWQVVNPETMEVLAERILLHPHDNEQPFTRSQSGIAIPGGTSELLVRARCTVHGFGEVTVLVDLLVEEGDRFSVSREQ